MKKILAIGSIVLILAGLFLYKAVANNDVRLGMVDSNLPEVSAGTYKVGENLILNEGEYAVYSKKGSGKVKVGEATFILDTALYEEAKKQPNNVKNAVIFEEAPKVKVKAGTEIIVESREEITVAFVKR